ncbi:MAG: hypothetical protein ACM3ZC_15475 [Bacteroidota bacterium]
MNARTVTALKALLFAFICGVLIGAWLGGRHWRQGGRAADVQVEIEPAAEATPAPSPRPGTVQIVLRQKIGRITGAGLPATPAPSVMPSRPAWGPSATPPGSPVPAAMAGGTSPAPVAMAGETTEPAPAASAVPGQEKEPVPPIPPVWEGTLTGIQTVTVLSPAGRALDTADLRLHGRFVAAVDAGRLNLSGELDAEDAVITLTRLPIAYPVLQIEASLLTVGAELELRWNLCRRSWGAVGIMAKREWPWGEDPMTAYGANLTIPIF